MLCRFFLNLRKSLAASFNQTITTNTRNSIDSHSHSSPHRAGNAAFAAKDFDESIKQYTNAINKDPQNHVYFSNRSASYASKKQYKESITDAKECIKLNPAFIKGFYRLATAQLETNDLDGAATTCKQGLNVDPGNNQLEKLLRQAKSKKASEKLKAKAANQKSAMSMPAMGSGDSSMSKELLDLQNQLRKTYKDLNIANANITSAEKNLKMNQITIGELERIPMEEERKMYRGIGKMFMMESKDGVFDHLKEEMKDDEKKMEDLAQKKDYLERRMNSQQQNIVELMSSK